MLRSKEFNLYGIFNWRGFLVRMNAFDPMMSRMVWFQWQIFWGTPQPWLSWEITKFSGQGSFRVTRTRKGKTVGWEFQGPVRRIGYPV